VNGYCIDVRRLALLASGHRQGQANAKQTEEDRVSVASNVGRLALGEPIGLKGGESQ